MIKGVVTHSIDRETKSCRIPLRFYYSRRKKMKNILSIILAAFFIISFLGLTSAKACERKDARSRDIVLAQEEGEESGEMEEEGADDIEDEESDEVEDEEAGELEEPENVETTEKFSVYTE
jgi:hypothetical protein